MARHRTLVSLPPELVAEIDKVVGARQRSAFVTELTRREIERRQQQQALQEAAGCWNEEDHPELAQGSEAWVREMRKQDEERFQELLRRQES